MERKKKQAYPVPMGGWCPESGLWTHNPHLKASREEQCRHNVEHGYLKKGDYNGKESD